MILIFLFINSNGDPTFTFLDSTEILNIRNSIWVLEDKYEKLTIKDVIISDKFELKKDNVPNLGVSSSAYWLKFKLKNVSKLSKLLLEITMPGLDEVDLYTQYPSGEIQKIRAGETLPFKLRKYKHQDIIFDLYIKNGDTKTYFLRVKSTGGIIIPFHIGSVKKVFEENLFRDGLFGVYCGILLIMFFYNLVIYFSLRDKSYLYYVLHTLFVGLTQASFLGYAYKYLWPNSPWMANESIYIFTCFVSIVGIEFLKDFLHTKEFTPNSHKILHIFTFTYAACIILSILGFYNLTHQILQISQGIITIFILYIAISIVNKGYRPAKFYLLAWSLFMAGIFIFVMKDLGILPYNNFTFYSMTAGSAIEVVLLSFALADRISILKKEKEANQRKALEALKENERIIKEQNVVLEKKVKERTKDLKKAHGKLQKTYNNLQDTQSQLVNAEKMASLGQLTAGIAHEMNNPINFISSNVNPLKKDIEDINLLLDKYEGLASSKDIEKELKEIEILKKELDSDYLKEEVLLLLSGIDEGAVRTADIISSLRTFSRLDEDDLKETNINDGLVATVSLLRTKLNGEISLNKDFGDIPKIDCYPGKLNQVFMNLLDNAIFAIQEKKDPKEKGMISIKTFAENASVKIIIKDNGTGIKEDILEKIFEPFFTTKDVGSGTGLGLSISYSIIDNHKGALEVKSKVGEGTEFEITLPIHQN